MSNECKAVPVNCRQRLAAEGKPYPRSSCAACGQLSPNWRECDSMLARPACQPSALAQQEDQNPRGPRELFQKWALSVEHPVKGWLDGRWLRRGDDREGYAEEYVQGLWVAFKAFGARPADQQAEPVAITELRHIFDSNKGADRTLVISKKLAAQLLADQPATTKVVLPARLQWNGLGNAANNLKASAWNACLDEVTKLNSGQA